jgi:hypothetical protein
VQGGCLVETGFHYEQPEMRKFSWGTFNLPTLDKTAAVFFSNLVPGLEFSGSCRTFFYLEYGSNEPALIQHLWHDGHLVFGNKKNSAFSYRYSYVIGSQIPLSSEDLKKTVTYALSIS